MEGYFRAFWNTQDTHPVTQYTCQLQGDRHEEHTCHCGSCRCIMGSGPSIIEGAWVSNPAVGGSYHASRVFASHSGHSVVDHCCCSISLKGEID